jgi:hypothetical protein
VLGGRVAYVPKDAVARPVNPGLPVLDIGDVRAEAERRMWIAPTATDERLDQDVVGLPATSDTRDMINEAVQRSVAFGINADYTRHSFEGTVGAPSASASTTRHQNAVAVTRGADGAMDVGAARGSARPTLGFENHAAPTRRVVVRTDHAYGIKPVSELGAANFAKVQCSGNRGDANVEPVAGTRVGVKLTERPDAATTKLRRVASQGCIVGSERLVVGTSDRAQQTIAVRKVTVVNSNSVPNRNTQAFPAPAGASRDVRHSGLTIVNERQEAQRQTDERLDQESLGPHRVAMPGFTGSSDRHGTIAAAERFEAATARSVTVVVDPRADRGAATGAEAPRPETHARRTLAFVPDMRPDRGGATGAEAPRPETHARHIALGVDPRADRGHVSTGAERQSVTVHRVSLSVPSADLAARAARPSGHRVETAFGHTQPRSSHYTVSPRGTRNAFELPAPVGAIEVGRQSFTAPFDVGGRAFERNERVDSAFAVPIRTGRTALEVDFRRSEASRGIKTGSVGETRNSRAHVEAFQPTARAAPVLGHSMPFGAATRGVHAREYEYDR